MLVNFFFVLSEASSDTITKWDFPLFTDFSVENSPLTTFLALVARPTRLNSLLLSAKFFHLLFQSFIHLFGNGHLEGTLQSLSLHCLLQAFH